MGPEHDLLRVDDAFWVVRAHTQNPVYDFAFDAVFPCGRRRDSAPITAVARVGAIRDYEGRFQELRDLGITLIHSPAEHLLASELSEWYPRLAGLTPRSLWFDRAPDPDLVAAQLGWPVFVKGSRQTSRHKRTLCVAGNADDYIRLVADFAKDPILEWQTLVIREWVDLRPVGGGAADEMPASFEFRTFWWRGELVGAGRYWSSASPYRWSATERRDGLELATEAVRRLDVPFLVVDLAQTAAGEWILIECNDGQESGYAGVSPLQIWQSVIRIERERS